MNESVAIERMVTPDRLVDLVLTSTDINAVNVRRDCTDYFDIAAGNLLDDSATHPLASAALQALPASGPARVAQLAGDAWEWTTSHYEPYPGYRPFDGALMEYNGKFMDNQRVLRGGSFATPRDHIRVSYRNFWPADTRFQCTGLRLAR